MQEALEKAYGAPPPPHGWVGTAQAPANEASKAKSKAMADVPTQQTPVPLHDIRSPCMCATAVPLGAASELNLRWEQSAALASPCYAVRMYASAVSPLRLTASSSADDQVRSCCCLAHMVMQHACHGVVHQGKVQSQVTLSPCNGSQQPHCQAVHLCASAEARQPQLGPHIRHLTCLR